MKTIREIAEEIGVSKQAVYKRYKGRLYQMVLPYVRRNVGTDTIYILEQGEIIIKQDFWRDSAYIGAHTEYTPDMVISMLKSELDSKNRQIAELTTTIKMLAERANRNRSKRKVQRNVKPITTAKTSIPLKRLMKN